LKLIKVKQVTSGLDEVTFVMKFCCFFWVKLWESNWSCFHPGSLFYQLCPLISCTLCIPRQDCISLFGFMTPWDQISYSGSGSFQSFTEACNKHASCEHYA
jgi:hypothetical protein